MKFWFCCLVLYPLSVGAASTIPNAVAAADCAVASSSYKALPTLDTAAAYISCLEQGEGVSTGVDTKLPPALLNTVAATTQCPVVPGGPTPPGSPGPGNPLNDIVLQLRMLKTANSIDDATWIAIMSAATKNADAMTLIVDQSKFPEFTSAKPFVVNGQNLGVKGVADQYWFTGTGYDSALAKIVDSANE